jgi:hypothetical protein
MTERLFLSYAEVDRDVLDRIAGLVADVGLGVSGRDFTRDELFVVGSPLQQLQAASAALVLITAEAEASDVIAREIAWAIEQGKGIVGLRLEPGARTPRALYDAGAEVLDAHEPSDLEYLPRALDASVRGAKLLELAASQGTGSGGPCARPGSRNG